MEKKTLKLSGRMKTVEMEKPEKESEMQIVKRFVDGRVLMLEGDIERILMRFIGDTAALASTDRQIAVANLDYYGQKFPQYQLELEKKRAELSGYQTIASMLQFALDAEG